MVHNRIHGPLPNRVYIWFLINILNWNCRGINSSRTRHLLKDLIIDNKVDLVAIQETKKEEFNNRCLQEISYRTDKWIWLPSLGRSGGILVGWDSNKIKEISHSIHRFCVNLTLENKLDNVSWQFIVVYGLVLRQYKAKFWK